MNRLVTRREVLELFGGATAGTMLSPAPWKLLDDVAIRTQNEESVAHPVRGRVHTIATHCPLCAAGCALRLRCVGEHVFAVGGVPAHALGKGWPCVFGLALHHYAGHPLRLAGPTLADGSGARRGLERDEAMRITRDWLDDARHRHGPGAVAVLDPRPHRATSRAYACWLAGLGGGRHLAAPSEDAPLRTLARGLELPAGTRLAWALDGCRLILSFGTPLLEGWGTPGLTVGERRGREERPSLIQVEACASTTARLADRWLRVRPGREVMAALALAKELLALRVSGAAEHSAGRTRAIEALGIEDAVASASVEELAAKSGLHPDELRSVARSLASERRPAVVCGVDPGGGRLGRTTERVIGNLAVLAGSVGEDGPIRAHRLAPAPIGLEDLPAVELQELEDVPDSSLAFLLVDAARLDVALPWSRIRRKLVAGTGRVVVLTPFDGRAARESDLALPVAAPLEGYDEIGAAGDLPRATFSVAVPLAPGRPACIEPLALLHQAAPDVSPLGALGSQSQEALLDRQIAAIHRAGRGVVLDGNGRIARNVGDGDVARLRNDLRGGGSWADEPDAVPLAAACTRLEPDDLRRIRKRILDDEAPEPRALDLLVHGWRVAAAGEPVPAVLSKLSRESDLRDGEGVARLHPDTAGALGLRPGDVACLKCGDRRLRARVVRDRVVSPGAVELPVGLSRGAFGDDGPGPDPSPVAFLPAEEGTCARVTVEETS